MPPQRAFFFPHALQSSKGPGDPPGRALFDVSAMLLPADGEPERDSVQVMADGYERDTVGPNQDPCVFSSPRGPFHSFCRLSSPPADNRVRGLGATLPNVVKSGDVIVYGKYRRAKAKDIDRIWVDTVLVVERVIPWPTSKRAPGACASKMCKGRKFVLDSPAQFARGLCGTPGSDAYKFNFSDAEPQGTHCCTNEEAYKVILGSVAPYPRAAAQLLTSFCTLAELDDEGDWWPAFIGPQDADAATWAALTAFLESLVATPAPHGGWISEFPSFELARKLVAAIIARSGTSQGKPGTVALPPLTPVGELMRWDPVSCTKTPIP